MSAPTLLDLGCGDDKLPGALGMDKVPGPAIDVVHDLDVRPWPLEANRFDRVRAQNVLEHVHDLVAVMEELHRVCRDGARVDILMPFMGSVTFATDPTHRRAAAHRSFEYFEPGTAFGAFRYSATARFKVERFAYHRGHPGGLASVVFKTLDHVVMPLAHRYPSQYECYFAGVYPVHNIRFTLRALK